MPLLLLVAFWGQPAFGAVYKSVDKDGNIVFTDKPVPGGREIDVPQPTTVRPVAPPKQPEAAPAEPGPVRYEEVAVAEPKDDEAVRSNPGNVTVKVTVEPYLDTRHGHRVAIVLDDKRLAATWDTVELTLQNIDRGTHTLRALILDDRGRIVARSETITFHLLRHSVLFR